MVGGKGRREVRIEAEDLCSEALLSRMCVLPSSLLLPLGRVSLCIELVFLVLKAFRVDGCLSGLSFYPFPTQICLFHSSPLDL